jgi:hypothetical protein
VPAIVATQTKGENRFARMVEFFDTVGTGDNTGYGWQGAPEAHPEAKARYRKVREARAKAAANQSMGS